MSFASQRGAGDRKVAPRFKGVNPAAGVADRSSHRQGDRIAEHFRGVPLINRLANDNGDYFPGTRTYNQPGRTVAARYVGITNRGITSNPKLPDQIAELVNM